MILAPFYKGRQHLADMYVSPWYMKPFVNGTTLRKVFILSFKGSLFFKNQHFIIQESFNKLIYGNYTIINCGKISVSLLTLKQNDFFSVSLN